MKVILLRDVARIGRRYDIKEVPSGYALNFLIPQKLAEPATSENVKRVNAQKQKHAQNTAATEVQFRDALKVLETTPVKIEVSANEQGHLFKGVRGEDIARAAHAQGIALAPEQIDLEHPLKELGEHTVSLSRGAESGTCTVVLIHK